MILNAYKRAICNLVKKYGAKEKFRISHVPTAQLLLDAAAAKQDDVHVRFADLQTPQWLIAADIYCHSNCKRASTSMSLLSRTLRVYYVTKN